MDEKVLVVNEDTTEVRHFFFKCHDGHAFDVDNLLTERKKFTLTKDRVLHIKKKKKLY